MTTQARVSTEVIEWAKQHGSLPAFSMAAQLRAYACLRCGSLADAEADALSALEHPGVPGLFPFGRIALVNVLLARGRATEARDVFAQVAPEPAAPATSATSRRVLACERPCSTQRTRSKICSTAAVSRRSGKSGRPHSAHGAPTRHLCWHRSTVRTRRARWRVRSSSAAALSARPARSAFRCARLASSSKETPGIELLEQSVAQLEQSSRRLEYAIALLELGAATRRAGRRAEARKPLREALELARACGADAVAVRAHDELVTAGARPRRDPTESRSNLTASELRVARMAAEGMTNREIAQALFLTENTIETHLRSVFRKLDIRSRSQLARAL